MPRRASKQAAQDQFKIREATEADLPILAGQRISMFREMATDPLQLDLGAYAKRYISWARRMMRRKKLVCFLVTDSRGNPVAGGGLLLREIIPSPRYPGTEQPYLLSMYTDPASRRKGLATMIVRHSIEWSRARGYPRLNLHASEMGEPVYARLGFERTTEMRLALDPRGKPTQPRKK
jgi:GNAT superfamily N-acetyltransferase